MRWQAYGKLLLLNAGFPRVCELYFWNALKKFSNGVLATALVEASFGWRAVYRFVDVLKAKRKRTHAGPFSYFASAGLLVVVLAISHATVFIVRFGRVVRVRMAVIASLGVIAGALVAFFVLLIAIVSMAFLGLASRGA